MKSFLSALEGWAEFGKLEEGLAQGASGLRVAGLSGAAKAYLFAGLFARHPRPTLILARNSQEAARLFDDIFALLGEESRRLQKRVLLFPSLDTARYEAAAPDRDILRARLDTLRRLALGEALLVVATPDGAFCSTLSKDKLLAASLEIRTGETIAREQLAEALVKAGYERMELVEGPGEFSLRGGVIDIWPSAADTPVRIEEFGDQIESLRRFDADTQRSGETVESITILPARELLLEPESIDTACARITAALQQQVERLEEVDAQEDARRLAEKVRDDLADISQHAYHRGVEYYLPYFEPEKNVLADYFPPEALVIWDEPDQLEEDYEKFLGEIEAMYNRRRENGLLLDLPGGHFLTLAEGRSRLAAQQEFSVSLMRSGEAQKDILLESGPAENFAASIDFLVKGLAAAQQRGDLVVAATRQASRLWELLSEAGLRRVHLDYDNHPGAGDILIISAPISAGFHLRGANLVVFTDGELFGWKRPPRAGVRRKETVSVTALSQLKAGDYVVHIHHGIGLYGGLVRQMVDDAEREYLLITYAGNDKLYVPTDQFDRVQKYIGGDASAPVLSRLGGKEWERAKRKAKRSAQDMADELVALYAARSRQQGIAFSPDTPWQMEMEAGFPYEETDDQHQAIAEVKGDMEKSNPMERLVCGDVGFGKTEVAVRAAFKAVMDGKQVAVLVPTTVLAAQHFNTFRERMGPYPLRVEMLSRFRSPKDRKRIAAELVAGAVDVVVGTHRLLSKDIGFKNLGLLVIDEEQRFGVRHKERLKQLRTTVDCITLTATPIPRTLHMALSGLREMSLINDPPEGRRPVRTHAGPHSDALVLEAVSRELDRGGQVYYVYNRVQSIPHIAAHLKRILPEVRIAIGHGQMSEAELEKVMVDFYAGKFDVLLCTTIIENGLDIPNVNTIVIDQADKLGLAQLYQLRGRVGRSDRQAYAYFMWTPHKRLTEIAQQRIQAIKEFADLGSGLKLALRDLEIRGAGDLLGAQQHGFVAAVGFDLYCQMLADAVNEARGQPPPHRTEVSLDLPVDAYIPDEWVPSLNQRIELYRRLAAAADEDALEDLAAEMRDRFGAPQPRPVHNLLRLVRIKLLCRDHGISRIAAQGGFFAFQLDQPQPTAVMRQLRAALALEGPKIRDSQIEPSRLLVPRRRGAAEEIFLLVEQIIHIISRMPES